MPEWDYFKYKLFLDFHVILIPIKDLHFCFYASVFYEQAFFIFGGYGHELLSQIGRFDAVTLTWSLAGSLKVPRSDHAVVFDGFQFLVIGGDGDFKTENCIPSGETITCTEQEFGLTDYKFYPELVIVDENYGKDC